MYLSSFFVYFNLVCLLVRYGVGLLLFLEIMAWYACCCMCSQGAECASVG